MRFLANENVPLDAVSASFHSHLPSKCGIILFRVPENSSAYIARVVVAAVESRSDWTGHFSVVEEYRIRMRPL